MGTQVIEGVRADFLEKIERRQKERQVSFEKLRQSCKLDEKAESIVSLPALGLLEKLRSRDLTATEVLKAFTAKALQVTETLNCVTEFNPEAEKLALLLDEKAKDKNVTLGPLHGLPIAVKDDQDVEGMDTTMGLARRLNQPANESAVIVKVLMKQGAIPFVKTNLPQSILSFGSDNPIYGMVKNGLRPELAPGGSSSGSGSIVAAHGAPVATGSDLGGSLRSPSHNHGLSSMRGTTNRLSEKGMVEATPVITQRGVPGIIAPDAKTLAFLWRCLTEDNLQNDLDPSAVPIPWNETLFSSNSKLRIGYFQSLPFLPAFPDTQKTVMDARDALLAAGHTVVPFEMPDSYEYIKVIYEHLFGHHINWIKDLFEGEPLSFAMKNLISSLRAPQIVVELREKMGEREKILSGPIGQGPLSGEGVLNNIYQKRVLTSDILGRMEKAGVDLILCPVFPFPAVKLEFGHEVIGALVYTMWVNFVDFPSGVVRFGTETASSVANYDDQGDNLLKAMKNALTESAGMPINVQVVGKPFKEELVLKALCEIERLRPTIASSLILE